MQNTDYEVVNPGFLFKPNSKFPFAPPDWREQDALLVAKQLKIDMDEEHWEIVRALQEYYFKHQRIRVRELLDALDEKFHYLGGAKFLLQKFPGGPINQGCCIGGLTSPSGTFDLAYGTVR